MDPDDRVGLDDGVDDRPQRAGLDGFAKPVERLTLGPDEDAVKSLVPVDRLFEVAGQVDDRSGRPTLPHAGEARGQQPVAGAIRNRVQKAPDLTHRGGGDIALLAVDHDLGPELTQ